MHMSPLVKSSGSDAISLLPTLPFHQVTGDVIKNEQHV